MPRRRRRKSGAELAVDAAAIETPAALNPPAKNAALMKWGLLAIVVITALAHLNSLYAKHFVYRDSVFVNALLDSYSGKDDRSLFRGPEPLALWSFDVNRRVNALNAPPSSNAPGFDPFGFHVGNLLLHVAAAAALALLIREAALLCPMKAGGGPVAGAAEALSIGAALLWAVHPLQTDAVAYLANRGTVLGGLSMFASLYLYLLYAAREIKPAVFGAIFFGLLAVLSSRTAIVLPLVALLLDRTLLTGSAKAVLRARWDGLLALCAVSVVGILVARVPPLGSSSLLDTGEPYSSGTYLLTQAGTVFAYLRLVFAPTGLSIIRVVDPVASVGDAWLPLGVIGVALAVGAVLAFRRSATGLLVLAFFLLLIPTSTLFPLPDLMAEHRMYAPLAVPAVLLCALVVKVSVVAARSFGGAKSRGWEVALGACVLLSLVLGYQTRQRNHDFADGLTLWRKTVAAEPDSAVAHASLAAALLEEGKVSEARFSARQAYELDPGRADAMTTEALALVALGDDEQAVEAYERAVVAAPKYEPAWYNLAKARERLARIPGAIDAFTWAIEIDDSARARNDLGVLLLQEGKLEAAEENLSRAVELDPSMTRAHFNLGNALARQGRRREAIAQYYIAIGQDNRYLRAYQNLGGALIEEQIYDEAIEVLTTANSIEPGNELTQRLLTIAENTLDRAGGRP